MRNQRKDATGQRVLAAARDLFTRSGYETTTVRAIAARAGVSVGSVFTIYPSKAAILDRILQDVLAAFNEELSRVAPNIRGSTADRLRSIFAIYFGANAPHTPLILTYISTMYETPPPQLAAGHGLVMRAVLQQCLADGQMRGDVSPEADLHCIVELLMAACAWTYRRAVAGDVDAAAMSQAMDQHIAVIASGYAPRA